MAFDFNNDNGDLFKLLMKRNNATGVNNVSGGNTFNPQMPTPKLPAFTPQEDGADGKSSGVGSLLGKVNPIGIGINALQSIGDIANAVQKPKFDFSQDNYTAQQAGQVEGDRASGIAKAATSGIPLVGGALGGIFGAIAAAVAKHRAEKTAQQVLGSRQEHINNLENYQMDKIKNNNFLKSSDLFKNMVNNQDNQQNNIYG